MTGGGNRDAVVARFELSAGCFQPWRRPWDSDVPPCAIALISQPHRRFSAGDVVFVCFDNGGGERWLVQGWSSKLHAPVRNLYVSRRHLHLIESPDRMTAKDLFLSRDPGTRDTMLDRLQAAETARAVRLDSGALSAGGG